MAKKPKFQMLGDVSVPQVPLDERSWARANGTYIAGRAHVDEVDRVAIEMESKWGSDRLRFLVGPELRERFDRQRYLFNQAIWHGDLEELRRESSRMIAAWKRLDAEAAANGKQQLHPLVWEVTVGEGDSAYVAAIVPDNTHAKYVLASGRKVVVYTLEEIAKLIQAMPAVMRVKEAFPGAEVAASRKSIDDPLGAIHDTERPLDEEIGF